MNLKHFLGLIALAVTFCIYTGRSHSQGITTLANFDILSGASPKTNATGAHPIRSLTLVGNTLYGVTSSGGAFGAGAIYRLNLDGSGFATVHHFSGYLNNDGSGPQCGLVASGTTLYGTTVWGGLSWVGSYGTVYSVNTDGSDENIVCSLDRSFVARGPTGGLVFADGVLYGTTYMNIFSVNSDGTGFTILHRDTGSDGVSPAGGLILAGKTLYGTTQYGGTWSNGTVYAINTDGSQYTVLHSFSFSPGPAYIYTNYDGRFPISGLQLSGDTLYGTAGNGGDFGSGTVFSMKTNGTAFTVLHSFDGNNEAAQPTELVVSGTVIYGAVSHTDSTGAADGKLFSLNTDGSNYRILCTLSNGWSPGGLLLVSNALFGVTSAGGTAGSGTVFKYPLLPQLNINLIGEKCIMTWPGTATDFTLQSSPNPGSAASWTKVSHPAALVDGQNTVTNVIGPAAQFFRLTR